MPGLGPRCKWGDAGEPRTLLSILAPVRVELQPLLPHSSAGQADTWINDSWVSTLFHSDAGQWQRHRAE